MSRHWWLCLQGFLALVASRFAYALPASAQILENLTLPEGFCISLFYNGEVPNARSIALSGSDTIAYVSSRRAGAVVAVMNPFQSGVRTHGLFVATGDLSSSTQLGISKMVYALVDSDADGKAESLTYIKQGLNSPNGVAWRDGALYIAEIGRVSKVPNIDSLVLNAKSDTLDVELDLVTDDFPEDDWHGQKYIAFGPDGRLYVPVGAPCNSCETERFSETPALQFGSLTRMNADGSGLEQFADGIRNTVGFDWHPDTGELWFTDNGRDMMGDNLPECELNKAPAPGLFFGFPYCHTAAPEGTDPYMRPPGPGNLVADPSIPGASVSQCTEREDFARAEQMLGPHVAPLGMTFYTGAAFPRAHNRSIFIANHGSWNRAEKIGYNVVEVRLGQDGRPAVHTEFVGGWRELCKVEGEPCGRPVDVIQYYDGSLLVSDDGTGSVYRVAYGAQCDAGSAQGEGDDSDSGTSAEGSPAGGPPAVGMNGAAAEGSGQDEGGEAASDSRARTAKQVLRSYVFLGLYFVWLRILLPGLF